MDIEYPSYYDQFHCIASSCKDSCCRGWCIDVDKDSRERYDRVPGSFGEKLRATLKEEKGNYFFPLEENGDCPFLKKNGLCEMICELGEDALCEVCQSYPRMKRSYGNYAQYDLNASCEEAFRLILSWDGEILRGREDTDVEEILSSEKERELINLIAFRSALWEEIPYFSKDFNAFFLELYKFFLEAELLIYPNASASKCKVGKIERLNSENVHLDGFSFLNEERFLEAINWQKKIKEKSLDFSKWRELFLEEVTKKGKKRFEYEFKCESNTVEKSEGNEEDRMNQSRLEEYFLKLPKEKQIDWEKAMPALCRYFLFRYTLLPLEEASLLPLFSLVYQSIEWIYTAYLLILNQYSVKDGNCYTGLIEGKEIKKEDKHFSCFFSEEPSILRIAVFFSKEIEHDEENIRQLLSYNPLFNICKKGV